jgi:hypothetical protein
LEVELLLRLFTRRVLSLTLASALVVTLTGTATFTANANEFGPSGEVTSEELVSDEVIPQGDAGNEELGEIDGGGDNDRQLRIAIETAHAFGSEDSNDLKGFKPSLYRGKWYMPAKEDRRRCIAKREAHHNYKAVSAGGLYRGAYQFSNALARGASWMMQAEVRKEMGEAGVDLVQELRKKPMNQWNRYWQDRAFWTIWANGRGSHHWHGGARSC